VQAGDLLVRFDIPAMRAEVQKQQAEVLRAGAAVEATRAAVARARELFDRGVAARREVEEATRAHAEADGALAQARASLAAAEAVASRAEVRAAFGGVIVKRLHNPGDLVDASASDPVLRVVDLRRLEVVAWVPLADVARVTTGAPAHVTGAPVPAPGLRLTVVAPAAATDGDTATAPVRLRTNGVPPWPVGTPLQVEIEAEHHANVVLVPRAAIVRDGDETAVFVASGGQAHRRTVTLGLGDDERVEIASGLAAGEAVVTDGHAGLPDGTAIRVADDSDDDRRTPVGGREGGDRP
jgi:RND family efflux transporter MFP subunit